MRDRTNRAESRFDAGKEPIRGKAPRTAGITKLGLRAEGPAIAFHTPMENADPARPPSCCRSGPPPFGFFCNGGVRISAAGSRSRSDAVLRSSPPDLRACGSRSNDFLRCGRASALSATPSPRIVCPSSGMTFSRVDALSCHPGNTIRLRRQARAPIPLWRMTGSRAFREKSGRSACRTTGADLACAGDRKSRSPPARA